jgi:hypothetical protein
MISKQAPQQPVPTRSLGLPNVEETYREIHSAWEMEEHLAIATRARELFEARGCKAGSDREDWLRAESELHLKE